MNLINELNDEQIKLLKEVDVVVDNRDYTNEERRYITNQIMGHIMNFSKKDISKEISKFENLINIIAIN